MKKILMLVLMASMLACAAAAPALADGLVGKVVYLQTNLWFEKAGKIMSTNYHKGTMIPAGTRVKILQVGTKPYLDASDMVGMDNESEIVFVTVEDRAEYRIHYVRKHHGKVSVKELANMYFKETDPLKSETYAGFTKAEKDAIQRGVIEKGMSKAAVLMSYGYPPQHVTRSLTLNTWIYWHSRYVRKLVQFGDDGRLFRIQ